MANPEIELAALRSQCEIQILESVQRHRGVQSHSWHEQKVRVSSIQDVEGG